MSGLVFHAKRTVPGSSFRAIGTVLGSSSDYCKRLIDSRAILINVSSNDRQRQDLALAVHEIGGRKSAELKRLLEIFGLHDIGIRGAVLLKNPFRFGEDCFVPAQRVIAEPDKLAALFLKLMAQLFQIRKLIMQ